MADTSSQKFYTYILQSLKDFSFYIGQTDDLDKRVCKHNDGFSKYSSSKIPMRLVYFEVFATRTEALKREKEIKNKKSRQYIQYLIEQKLVYWSCPGG
ncbi:MAG TPA: GIY-YIG nuclease family protein [Ferruginibacter sp.]|nr:GIY-YIG nuclease family protein [Ferruginibacter sp.]HMP19510.1 GIY-YIG nuclease family protein [Ferruginibacter sp.]